jgi:crossover junction endodeoxyribonuclease RuvC
MKILGIDPGMAIVGYSIIDFDGENVNLLYSGAIKTSKDDSDSKRLCEIYQDMNTVIQKYSPEVAAVEKLFFFKNQKTIIPVAEARGVIMAAIENQGVPAFEYTPMEVKQVLTGYGRADKKEVEQMVKIALGKENLPKLDDTVDSMAIAICHTRSNIPEMVCYSH